LRQAEETLEKLSQDIEQHSIDLVIAETPKFRWLAVSKIRAPAELPKNIRKRLKQVEKDLAAQKSGKDGGNSRKFSNISGGQEPVT
jgi:hypothetical protein